MKKTLLILCAIGAMAGFAALPFLVARAPIVYDLYVNQKIFYYHAPAAWLMFTSVVLCGLSSVAYLATRKPRWDDLAASCGDLSVVFGLIVLTTGPIWGRAAWGVWWVWDVRLTSSLLLVMISLAYALLRRYGGPGMETPAAGLAIFGMADVPLVYFAVNFWNTQHPKNTLVFKLKGSMLLAFFVSLAAYHLFYVVLLAARLSLRGGERRVHTAHEAALDAGLVE
jgi:heme exporter protein C